MSTTRKRTFEAYDPDTGEMRTWTEEYVPRAKLRDPYVLLFHTGIDRILHAHLTGAESRLLFEILRRSRVNEAFETSVASLANSVGADRSGTSRAAKTLINAGLVVRDGNRYQMNPDVAWRGSAAAREALRQEQS